MTDYLKEYQRWLTGDIFDAATKEELMQVEGIGEVQADRIMEKLNSEGLRHQ